MNLRRWLQGHHKTARSRRRGSFSVPRPEQLESRLLLAAIEWTNRGTAGDDSDGFGGLWGTQAETARGVVDAMLNVWENTIEDFNYSNGSNTFRIEVSASSTGTGIGAVAGPRDFDGVTPLSGSMTISRGSDTDGDGRGDGAGWYLDPIPSDSWEFQTITNPFVGDALAGTPAAGLSDLYAYVLHEFGHAVGFGTTDTFTARAQNTNQGDSVSGPVSGGALADLWAFDGRSVRHLLTAFNATSPATDPGRPVHTAPEGLTIDFNGVEYVSAAGLMSPNGTGGRRELISEAVSLMLEETYRYTLNPYRNANYHALLNGLTGELLIRGGPGESNDHITISSDTATGKLQVGIDLGIDTPGTGSLPGTGDLGVFLAEFPLSAVQSITVDAGDGADFISIGNAPGIAITVNAGIGDDDIRVGTDFQQFYRLNSPSIDIRGGDGRNRVSILDRLSDGDQRPYIVSGSAFTRVGALSVVSMTEVQNISVYTNAESTDIRVGDVPEDIELTIIDRGGADELQIGSETGNRLDGTRGTFEFFTTSGPNDNAVVFHDQQSAHTGSYDITFQTSGSRSVMRRGGGSWSFNGARNIVAKLATLMTPPLRRG